MERVIGNRHLIVGWEKDGKKGGDQREMVYEDKHLVVHRDQIEHVMGNHLVQVGGGEGENGNVDIVLKKNRKELVEADKTASIDKALNLYKADVLAYSGMESAYETARSACLKQKQDPQGFKRAVETFVKAQEAVVKKKVHKRLEAFTRPDGDEKAEEVKRRPFKMMGKADKPAAGGVLAWVPPPPPPAAKKDEEERHEHERKVEVVQAGANQAGALSLEAHQGDYRKARKGLDGIFDDSQAALAADGVHVESELKFDRATGEYVYTRKYYDMKKKELLEKGQPVEPLAGGTREYRVKADSFEQGVEEMAKKIRAGEDPRTLRAKAKATLAALPVVGEPERKPAETAAQASGGVLEEIREGHSKKEIEEKTASMESKLGAADSEKQMKWMRECDEAGIAARAKAKTIEESRKLYNEAFDACQKKLEPEIQAWRTESEKQKGEVKSRKAGLEAAAETERKKKEEFKSSSRKRRVEQYAKVADSTAAQLDAETMPTPEELAKKIGGDFAHTKAEELLKKYEGAKADLKGAIAEDKKEALTEGGARNKAVAESEDTVRELFEARHKKLLDAYRAAKKDASLAGGLLGGGGDFNVPF